MLTYLGRPSRRISAACPPAPGERWLHRAGHCRPLAGAGRGSWNSVVPATEWMRQAAVLLVVTFRSDSLHRTHPLRPLLAGLDRMAGITHLELPGCPAIRSPPSWKGSSARRRPPRSLAPCRSAAARTPVHRDPAEHRRDGQPRFFVVAARATARRG